MARLCFIDTETTGLDPDRHEVWEVACIIRAEDGSETEHVWQLPVGLGDADAIALNIGRYHERRWPDIAGAPFESQGRFLEETVTGQGGFVVPSDAMFYWARTFVDLTRGCHLVGAVVSFDADRLWRLLRRLDECPMWHYHLVDVEALAAGYVRGLRDAVVEMTDGPQPVLNEWQRDCITAGTGARPPWDSSNLSRLVGVDPDRFDRHTALGDAKWVQAIYDAVLTDATTTERTP